MRRFFGLTGSVNRITVERRVLENNHSSVDYRMDKSLFLAHALSG